MQLKSFVKEWIIYSPSVWRGLVHGSQGSHTASAAKPRLLAEVSRGTIYISPHMKDLWGMIWRRLQSLKTLLMMEGCSRPWHTWRKAELVCVQVDLSWQIWEVMTGPCSGLGHRAVWWDGTCHMMVMCLVKHAHPAYETYLLQGTPAECGHHTWHTGVPAVVAADK